MDAKHIVLFLGAGISLPEPAGGPLFAELRDACARRAGVDVTAWEHDDPRRALLDHLVPEVFLKAMTDAGFDLERALVQAVRGTPGTGPNDVHRLAAEVLAGGGCVLTTNWDTWIEVAYADSHGISPRVAVHPLDQPPPAPSTCLVKFHGSVDRPGSLLFTSPQVLQPLSKEWRTAIVELARGRKLFVAGYAGADVDLYPALLEATTSAQATYWLEGVGETPPSGVGSAVLDAAARHELWRFKLDGVTVDVSDLPPRGRWLVWCGPGGSGSSPSQGLLDALGAAGDVSRVPPWSDRFVAVDSAVRSVPQTTRTRSARLQFSALVNERLGRRWHAGARHAAVVVVGNRRQRDVSLRAIAHLVLLRSQPGRRTLNAVYQQVARRNGRSEFMRLQSGGVDHDADRARRIAAGTEEVSVDVALNSAMSGRWVDDLGVSETIARVQLRRALEANLTSSERDWPERVSRATFERAQALVWAGRYYEADDVCRTGYLRVSGSKWTAWEFAVRAVVRFVSGDYDTAYEQYTMAQEILDLEGFADFTPSLLVGRSACRRMVGSVVEARGMLEQAMSLPRLGPGSWAAIVAEQAEIAAADGQSAGACEAWRHLTRSQLPLWKAIAHLRLAEVGEDPSSNSTIAQERFDAVGCRWGAIRTRALRSRATAEEIRRQAEALGPADVFLPRGPWML